MKGRLMAFVCAAMLLTGCGEKTDSSSKSSKKNSSSVAVSESISDNGESSSQIAVDESSSVSVTDSSENSGTVLRREGVPATAKIGANGDKTVTQVRLWSDDGSDIYDKVVFTDMYERHVLHTGVVGRVGAPIEVDFDKSEISGGTLDFIYDPSQLNGVRPDALMFLWYDEERENYMEMEADALDTDNGIISLHITEPGTYVLVNMYTWLNTWGADIDDDGMEEGYDASSLPMDTSKWEQNSYTGQLLEIADKNYMDKAWKSGEKYFEVSDAGELAAAVCLINCGKPDATISLTADIDLNGYQWAPIGWSTMADDNRFSGTVEGNGHTIKNMVINSTGDSGFIGYGLNCTVNDISFTDANVSGENCGIIIGQDIGPRLNKCKVSGNAAGNCVGAIGGQCGSERMIDCTAAVTVNGKLATALTYRDEKKAEIAEKNPPKEKIWVDKNNCVCREGDIDGRYHSICWEVYFMGKWCLSRNADDETVFDIGEICGAIGTYQVYLSSFIDGEYIPISNTVTVDFGNTR